MMALGAHSGHYMSTFTVRNRRARARYQILSSARSRTGLGRGLGCNAAHAPGPSYHKTSENSKSIYHSDLHALRVWQQRRQRHQQEYSCSCCVSF